MRLLLDTYIWLWSLGEPVRLRARVRRELRDRTNELWLSPVLGLTLVTGDERLLGLGEIRTLANR
ncbi:MAG: hypothetical protein DMG22_12860 [Acidobacteria bacterium]|nr:MAG: hypothetical protein DMG22_12860 [Acidobacteriota bacterium]